MPRRKPGTLLPLETEILGAALAMRRSGESGFHGFGLSHAMREQSGSRALTGHGTLYKALGRLEEFGLLTSSWEAAETAEGRPRRRPPRTSRLGAGMTPERVTELVARWVRFYTRNLPAPVAERRIGEIDADLHDHLAH